MSIKINIPFEDNDDQLVMPPEPPNSNRDDREEREERLMEELDNEEEADRLRENLHNNVRSLSDRKRPLNILILGKPSQGQSAFLRSCATAALKKQSDFSMVGGEGAERVFYLKWFSMVNPREVGPMNVHQKPKDPEEGILLKHSPRILLAGMPDLDGKKIWEILRRILYGGIPLWEPLSQVVAEAVLKGRDYIRRKYWPRDDSLAIDRVVVVMSSVEEHPTRLVEALMKVTQPKGNPDPHDGYIYKRAVPVFGVVTMMDKIAAMNQEEFEKFKQRENSFVTSLDFIGAPERLGHVTNYFNNKDKLVPQNLKVNDPQKDCKILQFLVNLTDPNLMVENEDFVPCYPIISTMWDILQWLWTRPGRKVLNANLSIIVAIMGYSSRMFVIFWQKLNF